MKKYILSVALLFTLTFLSTSIMAQPEFDDDVEDTPVDGGVLLLLAGGAAYGLYKRRNEEETN